jgi:hypothetical protein
MCPEKSFVFKDRLGQEYFAYQIQYNSAFFPKFTFTFHFKFVKIAQPEKIESFFQINNGCWSGKILFRGGCRPMMVFIRHYEWH